MNKPLSPAETALRDAAREYHRTPVRGLYIAGDCGGHARGVGTELACQSGMDCADMLTSDLRNYVYGDGLAEAARQTA